MKNIFFILGFFFLSISFSYAQTKEQVIEADRLLNELIVKHLAEKAAEMYAEDFILNTSSGKKKSKVDMLKDIANPDLRLDINETSDVAVIMFENTVILTGILRQKGVFKNQSFDNKLRVTDTWVWTKQGNWKILAGHASLIP